MQLYTYLTTNFYGHFHQHLFCISIQVRNWLIALKRKMGYVSSSAVCKALRPCTQHHSSRRTPAVVQRIQIALNVQCCTPCRAGEYRILIPTTKVESVGMESLLQPATAKRSSLFPLLYIHTTHYKFCAFQCCTIWSRSFISLF